MLLSCAGHHIQHMQEAPELMNLKLTEVVSDITGKTGLAIIQAILGGRRDPACLARLRDPRCRHDEATIAKALRGNGRAEHLFALRQAVELYSPITARSTSAIARSRRTWPRCRPEATVWPLPSEPAVPGPGMPTPLRSTPVRRWLGLVAWT